MDVPIFISATDFADDVAQVREMAGPGVRFPLPTVLDVEPWNGGPRVTLLWAGRRYAVRYVKADDGMDEVALDLVEDGSRTRLVMRQDEVVGDQSDLPFSETWAVHAVAWRIWERADAARDALLRVHASEVAQALNRAVPEGFAEFASP